ncbi:MAG: ATP-binding protein [Planctomycetota bacterium]
MLHEKFIIDALKDNPAALAVTAESELLKQVGDVSVTPCKGLEVEEFARLGYCEIEPLDQPRPSLLRFWGGEDHDRLFTKYSQVVWQVTWQGHSIHAVHLEWENGCGGDSRDWVVADSNEIADAFILDVERKTHAPGNAILVFANGRWSRSHSLYKATQSASFDDLILADHMKDAIRDDFKQFLDSEERYTRLGIAWRRGALMIGPPGNGKTHCARALVKELNIASLYVQSLSHQYFTPEQMWKQVFDRARGLRPCILVLEDLDSLVDDDNRSFFLNQLDGFEQNHGMIVLATTNHAERIDSAIIDRPSRFDRKYHFNLPAFEERVEYLSGWQQRLAEECGWKPEQVESVAAETEEYSFAYLKELIISSLMKWMHESSTDFATVMTEQAGSLKQQMKTEPPTPRRDREQRPRRR